jgi:hypothetical protein
MELTHQLRRAAAVHEAGHAIVAWVLGLKVARLWIKDTGRGGSDIECNRDRPVKEQLALAEAGMTANDLLPGMTYPEAGLSDVRKIENLLDGCTDTEAEREQLRSQGCELAREILRKRVTLLLELADALVAAGCLNEAALATYTTRAWH